MGTWNATQIQFTSGGTVIEVNGPDGATDLDSLPMWVTELAEDKTRWTYRSSANEKSHWRFQLNSVTVAQKLLLHAFWRDTAKGPTETFTFKHTSGATYTARFIDTLLNWQRVNDNIWGVSFTLEISGTVGE